MAGQVEWKLGMRKYNKKELIIKVGTAAAIGLVTGGIGVSVFGRVSGLLKLAASKGFLTKSEAIIANYVIYGQYTLLKKIQNFFITPKGKESWGSYLERKFKQIFQEDLGLKIFIITMSLVFIFIPLFMLLNNKEIGSLPKRVLLIFAVFFGEPFDFLHVLFFIGLLGLAYGLFAL